MNQMIRRMKSVTIFCFYLFSIIENAHIGFGHAASVNTGTMNNQQLERLLLTVGREIDHVPMPAMLPDSPFLQLRNGDVPSGGLGSKDNARIVILRRGESTILQCEVLGMPSPVAYWTKNGAPLIQEQNGQKVVSDRQDMNTLEMMTNTGRPMLEHAVTMAKLRLTCVTPADAGVYECNGDNGISKAIAYTKVIVESADSDVNDCLDSINGIILQTPPTIYMYTEMRLEYPGNDAQLICRAYGKPHPNIRWSDSNDTPIKTGQNFTILSNGDLLVKSINFGAHQPFRQFNCQAANSNGMDAAIIDLLAISRS